MECEDGVQRWGAENSAASAPPSLREPTQKRRGIALRMITS